MTKVDTYRILFYRLPYQFICSFVLLLHILLIAILIDQLISIRLVFKLNIKT
jgi:hypothetical protein